MFALCVAVMSRADVLPVLGSHAVQQGVRATGTIIDEYGPVPGASVLVKGTTNGTVTDIDGNFSLDGVSEGAVLQISFLGYTTQEVVYAGKPLSITLKEDALALDEVVVTALGIQRESKALGYSISTIKASELTKSGTPNFATALYGKAAGVRVQAAPGGATSAVSINVRGLSSITGNNQPLVIVDGVPIRNGNANTDGYWENQRVEGNGLTDINPEDIENLSILKGASASALYGSEAANGVIMITTKSGKRGGGYAVDFNATLSSDFIAYMPEMQTTFGPGGYTGRDAYQWETGGFYMREVNGQQVKSIFTTNTAQFGPRYDGSSVYYWDGKVRPYEARTSNPWTDIFRTGFNQTYNVGITHGGENSNTRFSYTFVDNLPTQYNSTFNKHTFSISSTYNVLSNVSVSYTANYMREGVKNRPYRINRITNNFSGMFGSFEDVGLMREMTMTSLGYRNVYGNTQTLTPEESFAFQPAAFDLMEGYYWNILGREQLEDNNRLIGSVTPNWEIIKGLNLRGRIATDLTANKIENKYATERPLVFGDATGEYLLQNKRYEIYYGDLLLSYNKRFNELFDLTANAGWSGRREKVYNVSARTDGGLTVENWFNLNASRNRAVSDMKETQLLKTAFFGTLGVSYASSVYLEGTIRQEQSSTLAPGNNAFYYPSFNASYIFSEGLKDKKPVWFDYGKVRVSYGIVGNAPDVYYANMAFTQKAISGYTYNITPDDDNLGNDQIRPETKYEWEFGLESKFLGDRLGLEVSYYTNRVEDQILRTTVPISSGGKTILLNIGELENTGLEVMVYGTPLKKKDYGITVNANISLNSNKVTKLMEGLDELTHSTIDNAVEIKSLVGQPMGDIYAYVPLTNGSGEKVVGSDGRYLMDFSERKKVANAMPKLTGGFGASGNYKNFFIDALFDFRIGGAILNTPYQYMMGRGNLVESMDYRDAAHGGLSYYFEDNDFGKPRHLAGSSGYNGEKLFDNGIILAGVKEDGSKNDIIVPVDNYYINTYGWGASGTIDYSNSIFENTYLKFRELSIGYRLPSKLSEKFSCKGLSVSVFGRNLAYLYKNLPAFDAEATDGTSWVSQTQIEGSTATTRSFGFSLRANF
jgi:TonB-linked SusC/RagA family outer membrane protein